jgi:plastocyanin
LNSGQNNRDGRENEIQHADDSGKHVPRGEMMKTIRISNSVDLRWRGLALLAIALLLTLGSAASPVPGGGSSEPQNASAAGSTDSATEVKIDNFAFTPAVITVKAGTQVTWVNHDDIPHTVDSTEGNFKSAALDTDDKFQFRFTEPGEYPFFCRMHPKMTGKVVVRP